MNLLLEIGLSNALLATVVAGMAVVASWLFRQRPALMHSLWLLVLLKLVTPPLVPFAVPWPTGETQPRPTLGPTLVMPVHGEETPAGFFSSRSGPTATGSADGLMRAAEPHELDQAEGAPSNAHRAFPWTLVGAIWLLGAGLWWLLAAVRIVRFQTSLHHARRASPALQAEVSQLARRLGLRTIPEVLLLPARVAPLLWAVGRSPRLLLPAVLWAQLGRDERQTLLVHELAHLRRRDHWVRRLELFALGVYWWHPVAWWAHRKIQEAEEQCCDAWVLWALPECGASYAQALVHTLRHVSRTALPVGASGIGPIPDVKRRLMMILQGTTPRRLSGLSLGAVVVLALLVLPFVPTPAHSQQPKTPHKGAKTAKDAIHAAQIDKAKAEVTLLKAELAAKKGEIRAMESQLRKAQEQLAKLEGRHGTGMVFTVIGSHAKGTGVLELQHVMTFAPGILKIVEQAHQPSVPKLSAVSGTIRDGNMVIQFVQTQTPAQRLADLEKQMNAMLKEMAALREELQVQGPKKK